MNEQDQEQNLKIIYGGGHRLNEAFDEFNRKIEPHFVGDDYISYSVMGPLIVTETNSEVYVYQQVLVNKQRPQE